jgi:hypothetical protein
MCSLFFRPWHYDNPFVVLPRYIAPFIRNHRALLAPQKGPSPEIMGPILVSVKALPSPTRRSHASCASPAIAISQSIQSCRRLCHPPTTAVHASPTTAVHASPTTDGRATASNRGYEDRSGPDGRRGRRCRSETTAAGGCDAGG